MLAKRAVIHNYRSVAADCTLEIDPKVTVLVGATESGKTTILRALEGFSAAGAYDPSDLLQLFT